MESKAAGVTIATRKPDTCNTKLRSSDDDDNCSSPSLAWFAFVALVAVEIPPRMRSRRIDVECCAVRRKHIDESRTSLIVVVKRCKTSGNSYWSTDEKNAESEAQIERGTWKILFARASTLEFVTSRLSAIKLRHVIFSAEFLLRFIGPSIIRTSRSESYGNCSTMTEIHSYRIHAQTGFCDAFINPISLLVNASEARINTEIKLISPHGYERP